MFDPITIAQIAINGLLLGGLYALAVSGLSLIFGVMRVPNFAHGELIMLGAYGAFWIVTLGHVHPLIAMVLAVPLVAILGLFIQRFLLEPLTGAPMLMPVLLLYGASLFLMNGALFLWSGDYRSLTEITGSFLLGDLTVSKVRLLSFGIAVGLVVLVWQVLHRTTFGKTVRATAQHPGLAVACGIDVRRVRVLTFGLGAAMAAAAGSLIINIYAVEPTIGQVFIIKMFAIAILGGLGSYVGGFFAAILIGLIEAFAGFFGSPRLADVTVYGILVLALLLLPRGLMGGRQF